VVWRWDTPADAREFGRALGRYVERGLHGRRLAGGAWETGGAAVATAHGAASAIAFAPEPPLARRLARAAAGSHAGT
jgi:hypothetical protein